jgi:hypothetical protein
MPHDIVGSEVGCQWLLLFEWAEQQHRTCISYGSFQLVVMHDHTLMFMRDFNLPGGAYR